MSESHHHHLRRTVGLPGAVSLGLGSMVGTGVFAGLALGASVAGAGLLVAVLLAGALALANGLSSAQLAANHPVSGGTYEYGYRYLNPTAGFVAGTTFLLAKAASAATAALALAGYLATAFDLSATLIRPIALVAVALITLLVLGGLRRSNRLNTILVIITLGSLLAFALPPILTLDLPNLDLSFFDGGLPIIPLLEATALIFVAYTGYGRIATLGEEVRDPSVTIPRAVFITIGATALLYLLVSVASLGGLGAIDFGAAGATGEGPLDVVLRETGRTGLLPLLTIGAVTAMLGVLLNLILGLSRVVLAMGRRGDAPSIFARVDTSGTAPRPAIIAVALLVAALAMIGDIMTTWSISAFAVLIYYGINNLAALRLGDEERMFPRAVSVIGLVGCVGLAPWIDWRVVVIGVGIVLVTGITHRMWSQEG